jgi:hypothetical protein
MGVASSTDGRDEKHIKKCESENVKGRNHLKNLGIEGRII